MSQKALIYVVTNLTIFGMLIYLSHDGELKPSDVPLVAAVCFICLNGLVFFMFRRKKT
jgi:hypothetical protein